MEHVDAAASQARDGLVVAFAFGPFAVVISARRRMLEAGERGEEEGVLEAVVAVPAGDVPADGGAGVARGGPEAGVGGEVGGRREVADVPDLNRGAGPEAAILTSLPGIGPRLGEGEISAFDLRAELLQSGEDAVEWQESSAMPSTPVR